MPPIDSIQSSLPAPSSASVATRIVGQAAGASAPGNAGGIAANARSAGDAASTDTVAIHPNPAAVLDPASGLVVMEYRNAQDQVVRTVPNRQQIDAYESTQWGGTVRQAETRSAESGAGSFHGSATQPADPGAASADAADPVSDAATQVAAAQAALADAGVTGSVVQTSSTTGS